MVVEGVQSAEDGGLARRVRHFLGSSGACACCAQMVADVVGGGRRWGCAATFGKGWRGVGLGRRLNVRTALRVTSGTQCSSSYKVIVRDTSANGYDWRSHFGIRMTAARFAYHFLLLRPLFQIFSFKIAYLHLSDALASVRRCKLQCIPFCWHRFISRRGARPCPDTPALTVDSNTRV